MLACALRRASPLTGAAYTASPVKRTLDLAISLPAALLSAPLVAALALANRWLLPQQRSFFIQRRVGHGGSTPRVVKIRSMVTPGSRDSGAGHTSFGRFLRRTYLDELPQLWQTLSGRLSLVGIRILPPEIHQYLAQTWSAERYRRWREVYGSTPLGLSGVHQVFRGHDKEDAKRFHRDLFYARRASLGFDLYIIWRTLARIGSGSA